MEVKKEILKKITWSVIGIILFHWALQNNKDILSWLNNSITIFLPIIVGLTMAFLINIPMRTIEKNFFSKAPKALQKVKRPLSLILTLILIFSIIGIIMVIIVPEFMRTIEIIKVSIPGFSRQLQGMIDLLVERFPELQNQMNVTINWVEISKKIMEWVQSSVSILAGSTVSVLSATFSGVFTFIVGFVLALYVLLQKEKLGTQLRKVCYAYGKESMVDESLRILALANTAFSKFFTGQCLEAVIIGILFFISMSILGFPYALMISVTIGFTALIPIFGAFLGCFIGVFLIVVASPGQTLWFIVLFLILQQLEGNLIYPRVVGNSIGLPGIWVLIAVTIGGNMFGVIGMLIMVPICSVVYTLLGEGTKKRLKQKGINRKKIIN